MRCFSEERPVLSMAHLISSAQMATRGGRLGLQRGATEPLFVDGDGSVCAIGAALPAAVLRAILRAGHQRRSWLDLTRAAYFGYDDLDTVEALAGLQLGYDACFLDGSLDARAAGRFCGRLLSLDPYDPPTSMSWPGLFDDEATSSS